MYKRFERKISSSIQNYRLTLTLKNYIRDPICDVIGYGAWSCDVEKIDENSKIL